jgi:hypothetical protein
VSPVNRLPHPTYPRLIVGDDGSVIGPSGKTLKHFPDKNGYRRINIYTAGQWRQLSVHRLVCETFIGLSDLGVAHIDGDPANNQLDNLRWSTQVENEADKREHGRMLLGSRHHQAKLNETNVRTIREQRALGVSLAALANSYGVSRATISRIALRKTWRHI